MEWTTFFKEAGLPQSVAIEYSIIFSDNRMKIDTLPDITKDILTEMGIRKMGDVLAILRHAKTVHAQEVRKKEATLVKSSPVQKSVVSPLKRLAGPGSVALATRVGSRVEPVQPKPRLTEEKPLMTSWLKSDVQLAVAAKKPGLTRKVVAPVSLSSLDTRTVKRRADDAGSYTIKMPQGTTAKTRQVLQLQSEKALKPAVFSRLGVSTSSEDKLAAQTSIFNRLGSSLGSRRIVQQPAATTRVISSGGVQSRLGSTTSMTTRFLRQDEAESNASVFDRLGSS